MESRKDFFADEFSSERMNEVLEYVISNLTLTEILKMIREISYDMVCYYDVTNKGHIYNGEYDKDQILEATRLQRLLSSACDLFGQSIIKKRKFGDSYLAKYLDGGSMELKITLLEERIKILEEELKEKENNEKD